MGVSRPLNPLTRAQIPTLNGEQGVNKREPRERARKPSTLAVRSFHGCSRSECGARMVTNRFLKSVANPMKTCIRYHPYPLPFHHFLRNLPSTQYTKLENGLTIVTEEREVNHASGTKARTRPVLEDQMASTGARFDCVTTRELVGYRVTCLLQHVPLCLDLLTDCVFNNNYSETDIEWEKKVVYLEMQEHDRDPNCLLDDYLHATAFQGTPLARTVMGPSCNLHNFSALTVSRYINKYFGASRTVLAAIGGVKHEQIVALANTYMSKLEPNKCIDRDVYRFTGSEIRARDDSLPLAMVALAVEGPALCDVDRLPMEVAAEIIGGWDKSHGGGIDHAFPVARASSVAALSDAYQSFYIAYKDTGLWGVKFMGHSLVLDDMLGMVQEEFMNLCNTVTEGEVERAKRVLKTKLVSEDVDSARMCSEAGRWALFYGHRASLAARIASVESVFAPDVRAVCQRYLYDRCPAVAAVGPTEVLSDYTRIRAGMYWLRI
ncbi:Mitochondrial processing peptidase beta subunit [Operophtera brumata]|uniref:Mitochondrial processing peptidase beta subunit n=1 Tax=Operophtera brumata TaxID=104452 RepID=A0A0L7KV49_OPEBR|nr:Mitochondrial processing peptidase beta subunit [Operophtera brumata]